VCLSDLRSAKLYLHLLQTIAKKLFLLGPQYECRCDSPNGSCDCIPDDVDLKELPISRMMFVSEECNLAAVPQFQKSRRADIYSKDLAILHTELPPARKGKNRRKDISLVPIRVPLWFLGYLIVCGQLRLREIIARPKVTKEMVERELGLQQGLKGMRTIDVLSHLLGFEAVYPGLSTCQWRDIRLDAFEAYDYRMNMRGIGHLNRFIALDPTKLKLRLWWKKCNWLQGDGNEERVISERLQEMSVDVPFRPDEYAVLLDYLVNAAPNLRSLSVCAGRSIEDDNRAHSHIREALEAVEKSIFPKLMRVMGQEAVVEFELDVVVPTRSLAGLFGGPILLLSSGVIVEKQGFVYSRSLAITRGEGLSDWYLSFHAKGG